MTSPAMPASGRRVVAWCAACEYYDEASQIGKRCHSLDCDRTLRKRVGYVCEFCEQDGAETSMWLTVENFIAHLVEHVRDGATDVEPDSRAVADAEVRRD